MLKKDAKKLKSFLYKEYFSTSFDIITKALVPIFILIVCFFATVL